MTNIDEINKLKEENTKLKMLLKKIKIIANSYLSINEKNENKHFTARINDLCIGLCEIKNIAQMAQEK